MPSFVVRVWLPDRPGALGAVATSIGSVGGDLTGIEILETGAGRAVDELIVSLPSVDLVSTLVTAMCTVDGVDVEDIHPGEDDVRLDTLEAAAAIAEQAGVAALELTTVEQAARHLAASWCALLDSASAQVVVSVGSPPPAAWLSAFVAGSRSSDLLVAGESGPDDIAWAGLGAAARSLVLGRTGRPFHARERQQLALLGRIAGSRWVELAQSAVGRAGVQSAVR